ncbi:hydroxyethylthiazole kinase [Halomonas sp. HK25]|uniref:hydroxyethylthiazole kinase n=1 Tax=Halomonas sp. HK25 TaxID=3394321 RepID=UPI0039FC8788
MSHTISPSIDPASHLSRVRERAPLVHNITNLVAMNTMANVLLAIGAPPADGVALRGRLRLEITDAT